MGFLPFQVSGTIEIGKVAKKCRTMEQRIREKSCEKLAKSVDLWNLVYTVLANTYSNENTLRASTSVTHENRQDETAKESCSINGS